MAAFPYFLEFLFDDSSPSDAAVYIQMRNNPPIYQEHITKEAYDILDNSLKNDFLTFLFDVSGVTELSTKAYRIWIMKSPVYTWEEVLTPIIAFLANYFGFASSQALPGSGRIDGTGFTLATPDNRRSV